MALVYKICGRPEWMTAEAVGIYRGSPDDLRDGFIHLSAEHQVTGTLDRHFAGRDGLVLVAFEELGLHNLRWEASRGGDLFPHVHGPLDPARALWAKDLPLPECQP